MTEHTQGTLIEAKDVDIKFEVGENVLHVLKNVSLTIPKNSYSIIYGPSGSGKSTLLNVISALQRPTAGKLMFEDHDLYALSSEQVANFRASSLGIVYQTNYWVKSLNVVENVALPLYFLGYRRGKANKMALESLGKINMDKFADYLPTQLSGGEQQRVSMARALVNNPEFVVADEPTGNLDSKSSKQVMDLLKACQKDLGRTVVMVTHDLRYLPYGDKYFYIQDGILNETKGQSPEELIMQAAANKKKPEAESDKKAGTESSE